MLSCLSDEYLLRDIVEGCVNTEDEASPASSMFMPLLAIAPATVTWSPKVALVMIICNVIAIAIGKATIKYPNEGAKMPSASFFGGMSHGAMLGCTSFGHILGMGAILGLSTRGVL